MDKISAHINQSGLSMSKIVQKLLVLVLSLLLISACNNKHSQTTSDENKELGKAVFLIGNEFNIKKAVNKMIEKSGIRNGGYVAIIPTSFQVNDRKAKLLSKEFNKQGIVAVHVLGFPFKPKEESSRMSIKNTDVLAIENASILCLLDGKINKFMKLAKETRLKKALLKAKEKGTLIAGIGNGASILGDNYFFWFKDKKTNKKKIALTPGLGLLENTVVDDLTFLKNNRKRIRKETSRENFLFIGLADKTSVWIKGLDAVVLSETGISIVRPDTTAIKLGIGDEFSLLPK